MARRIGGALPGIIVCTIAAATSARAQTARTPGQLPVPDRAAAVGAMLRSDDAREQAWDAHYAGRR